MQQQGGPLGPGSAAGAAASAINGVDPLRKQGGSMMNGGGGGGGGSSSAVSKGPVGPTNLFGNKWWGICYLKGWISYWYVKHINI